MGGSKRNGSDHAARTVVKLLRRVVTIPSTTLAKRIKRRDFALAEYNRVAQLVGRVSYGRLVRIVEDHDRRRQQIAA